MELTQILLIVFGLWLLAVSIIILFLWSKFFRATKEGSGSVIKEIEALNKSGKENSRVLKQVQGEIDSIIEENKFHIQKFSLVRFNPFNETGGDHSFSLVLLNKKDSGMVITGLHTRERTRIYVKPISQGKSKYELSKEELTALEKAKKYNE